MSVSKLFKRAMLECAENGEIERCANVPDSWLSESGAAELAETIIDIDKKLKSAHCTGIEDFSLIGLLGPLTESEPVLASVLTAMVRMDDEQ